MTNVSWERDVAVQNSAGMKRDDSAQSFRQKGCIRVLLLVGVLIAEAVLLPQFRRGEDFIAVLIPLGAAVLIFLALRRFIDV